MKTVYIRQESLISPACYTYKPGKIFDEDFFKGTARRINGSAYRFFKNKKSALESIDRNSLFFVYSVHTNEKKIKNSKNLHLKLEDIEEVFYNDVYLKPKSFKNPKYSYKKLS